MSAHSDVRAAFRAALIALAGMPAAKFWEGEAFTTTVGTPYVLEKVSPISSRPLSVAGAGHGTTEHTILLRATLGYPAGKGTNDIETAADAIMARFPVGSSVSYGATAARVDRCERTDLRQEPGWINCTVTITTTAYTHS